ncbi:hypothetical protein ASE17_18475 [Phenylobacterium sp. Root77]|uniref:hypothetical protein n=1 Tax=unclassified Phenylobacterium TaxID=2640670 RepID=UPI0006F51DC9|nr:MULTISPECIES: hypothetical protein [unclassified Phenylobacterium]KQW70845.1 hypothetical protein ASC73_12345 [Phenylobacterium sp. Root1277]KQW90733.1 hypothetical protein ASC79_15245 [Phenylobacterium sp. Root1290]KRC39634.1 hypothetical protein ASE17_18475 [Phenylobacterium sp. Root77]
MTLLLGGLLAVAAGLVGVARRTYGRPPLWRSWAALAGAVVCLGSGIALVIVEPSAIVETPVLFVAGFCLFEGSLALLSLMAAAGRPQPKWLS